MSEEMGKEKEASPCFNEVPPSGEHIDVEPTGGELTSVGKAGWLCLILGASVTFCGHVFHLMGMSMSQFIGLVFFTCLMGALFWYGGFDLLKTERWPFWQCVGIALFFGLPWVTFLMAAVAIIANHPILGSLIVGGIGLLLYFVFSLSEKKDEGHE